MADGHGTSGTAAEQDSLFVVAAKPTEPRLLYFVGSSGRLRREYCRCSTLEIPGSLTSSLLSADRMEPLRLSESVEQLALNRDWLGWDRWLKQLVFFARLDRPE